MKRCINRFMLVQYFESNAGSAKQAARPEDLALAKWLAATERWPALRRVVLRPNEQIDALASHIRGGATHALGSDLDALIREPGVAAWWSRELRDSQQLQDLREAELCLRRWGL
jgi:hypothetical protein